MGRLRQRRPAEAVVTEHRHRWIPIAGEVGQYACAGCSALGWRGRRGVVSYGRRSRLVPDTVTARPTNPRRLPTLEDYDQGLA
jgi:hypothetical protein